MKLPKHTTHTYTHHTLNTHKTSQQFSYSLMSVCQTNVPQLLPYVPKYVPSLFHDGRLIDMAGSINYDLKLSTVLNSSFLCHRKKNTTFNYNTSNNMTDFFLEKNNCQNMTCQIQLPSTNISQSVLMEKGYILIICF